MNNILKMGGWKTISAGVGLILTGLAVLTNCYAKDDYTEAGEGITAILGGLAAFGIGHKIEKTTKKEMQNV
jgi:hypothetical protein